MKIIHLLHEKIKIIIYKIIPSKVQSRDKIAIDIIQLFMNIQNLLEKRI